MDRRALLALPVLLLAMGVGWWLMAPAVNIQNESAWADFWAKVQAADCPEGLLRHTRYPVRLPQGAADRTGFEATLDQILTPAVCDAIQATAATHGNNAIVLPIAKDSGRGFDLVISRIRGNRRKDACGDTLGCQ